MRRHSSRPTRLLPLRWLCLVAAVFGVTGCGWIGSKLKPTAPKDEPKPFGETGIPPELRARGSGNADGSVVAPGGNKPGVPGLALTPREDIVFTNPDDPEAQLPELADLLAAPKSKTWEDSETLARRRAAREGKPLLIWFTSSQNSPMCKALNEELFTTSDFEKWANEKLVRLRVDDAMRVDDPGLSLDEARSREIDVKNYAAELKMRFKVMGHPTLILLNSSGEVIGRYVGYKRGGADFTWGLLKHGESVSTRAYAAWRDGLEKKGYREWRDRRERKVFAKLVAYAKGELTFVEPDGTRSRTHEDKLSDVDRSWLSGQKNHVSSP
ncbi:MAG: thioredoxin family protein [Verrucomicrobia bacterium]|nr:MAG: thioredoxin family protein [Verrucomicrobiota bacterium]